MLKDEVNLTEPFLRYHAALFGAENLYVVDNGTTDPAVLRVLEAFEREGVTVDRSFPTAADFRRKGEIIGNLVKRLDEEADYDFYILLDCDEFVMLRSGGTYTCDPVRIQGYMHSMLGVEGILKVGTNLANIPGQPDVFQVAEYSKTIFPRNVLGATDHGHHAGWTRSGTTDFIPCDIVYVHFHYRPYDEVVRFARQKLGTEMSAADLNDPEKLRAFRGRGWHLARYLLEEPASYYGQFEGLANLVRFPELLDRFAEIGIKVPFSGFRPPIQHLPRSPAAPRNWPYAFLDEVSTRRVRGWATDPEAPNDPVSLTFCVDGAEVWKGVCDGVRRDVKQSCHSTTCVGFDFTMLPGKLERGNHVLSVKDGRGVPVRLMLHGQAHDEIVLPASEGAAEPLRVVIDEASTKRLRGWAIDLAKPREPVFLRFLLGGALFWEGPCFHPRPDVHEGQHSTNLVGFEIAITSAALAKGPQILTIQDREGATVHMMQSGHERHEIPLVPALEGSAPHDAIFSHIDSFRNGQVRGWVLRITTTPDGPRPLGRCTVVLTHGGRVVAQAIADLVRADVAAALQGEERCGFVLDVPRQLFSSGRNTMVRLLIMPEQFELTGSPCVVAPSFSLANA